MFESKLNRGKAGGYAPLDGTGKVPLDKLPPIQSTIDTGSFVTTSQTGSFATTSSLQTLINKTGSFATTGSNTFFGEQTVSGSVLLTGNIGGALTLVDNVETFTSQINFIPSSSGDGYGLSTIELHPDITSYAEQYLIIDPTYPNHIHIRGGGTQDNSQSTLIIGGENSNFGIPNGENPSPYVTSNNYFWSFEGDGGLRFPDYTVQTTAFTGIDSASFATTGSNQFSGSQTITGSLTVSDEITFTNSASIQLTSTLAIVAPPAGIPNSVSTWSGGGGWNQMFYSNVSTTGGTGTGLTVDVNAESNGYIDIEAISINTPGSGYTDGDVIVINNENNLPGTFIIGTIAGDSWTFGSSGLLTTPGGINVNGQVVVDGGHLILTGSSVPTSSTGSLGDREGTVVFDDNYLYYCTARFEPETYTIVIVPGTTYNTHVSIPKNQGIPALSSNNWSITTQDNTTYILTGVYSDNDNWDCEIDNLNSTYNGGIQIVTLTNLNYEPADIWKQVPLGVTGSINGLALKGNDSTAGSIAVGTSALVSNIFDDGMFSTGINNIAVGNSALLSNTTGRTNIALGPSALYNNTVGQYNIAIGSLASSNNTSGSGNIGIGSNVLQQNQGGSNNVAIGNSAGFYPTSGSNNVYLGTNAGPASTSPESNKLYIANDAGTPLIGGDFAAKTVTISGSLEVKGSISGGGIVTSSNVSTIQTITSASYAGITPVSGTLYILIG